MEAEGLLSETNLLFHALKRWAETLHEGLELTAPRRGVLELLLLRGPATVAGMARARGVSRQHVQQQVDALIEEGFVGRRANPAHKRSSLIGLTDKGRALIETMRAEELDALSRLQVGVSDASAREAAHVLHAWRDALHEDTQRRRLEAAQT